MAQGMQFKFIHYVELADWGVTSSFYELERSKYPLCPLGVYLRRAKEQIEIEDGVEYKQITVRLYGQGVIQRGIRLGKDIGTKKQFIAHAGQLIMSRIDARNGAFGIVPDYLDGAVVTNDFWLFDAVNASADFLMLLLSSARFQEQWRALSTGTTNRQRVSERDFLSFLAPIPPMQEQLAIVSDYMDTLRRIGEKQKMLEDSAKRAQVTLMNALQVVPKEADLRKCALSFESFSSLSHWSVDKNTNEISHFYGFGSRPVSLKDNRGWLVDAFRGKSPVYQKDSGHVILNQKCNRWDFIDEQHAKTVASKWYGQLAEDLFLKENDIIVNSTGEGTLGRASVVTPKHAGYLVDSHILVLRLNTAVLSPEFIVKQINSEFGQKQVELLKGAQATKQTELGIENLLKMKFVIPCDIHGVPDLAFQRAVVEEMKKDETLALNLSKEIENLKVDAKKALEKTIFG